MNESYEMIKKRIESGVYDVDNMKESLDVYLAFRRITTEEYKELMEFVSKDEEKKFKSMSSRMVAAEDAIAEIGGVMDAVFEELDTISAAVSELAELIDKLTPAEEPSEDTKEGPSEDTKEEPESSEEEKGEKNG